MSAPIPLRRDFGASQLRGLAKKTKDGPQARRLLALAAIYDGATRTEAAMIGGVGLQIIRDWVLHFNERGPDGLLNGKSPGQPSKLNDVQRQAIARMIESGPIPAVHGVVRWRLIDLAQWIFEEFRIAIAKQTLSRELRAMGYRKLSARPRHHAQAEGVVEAFKKASPRAWIQSRARKRSTATRSKSGSQTKPVSARRTRSPAGGRSAAPARALRGSAHRLDLHLRCHLPGARQGRGPRLARMQHRGDELAPRRDRPDRRPAPTPCSSSIRPDGICRKIGRAGQHHPSSPCRQIPELNPVENIWQFLRENWLSNRVFKSYDDLVDHCCEAWNKLVDQPWRIMSIGLRQWAHEF